MATKKTSTLDWLKHRKDQTLMPLPRLSQVEQRLTMQQVKDVAANSLDEISGDVGYSGLGTHQTDSSGTILHRVMNDVGFFDAINFQWDFEENVIGDYNTIELIFDGHIFQNTGANQNLNMRLFLGPVGDEVQIDSTQAISVPSSAITRAFRYVARISQAPNLGSNIRVNEYFTMENTSTGAAIVLMRSTQTYNSAADNDISKCTRLLFLPTTGSTTGTFRFFSDAIQIKVHDGEPAEERHWYSNKTHMTDTRIIDSSATTNYGNNVVITVGENNAATSVSRALIRAGDLQNIPSDAILKNAYLYLTVSADLSSTSRTIEVYRSLRNWVEGNGTGGSGATWNTYDGTNAWGTAGSGNSTTDYDGANILGSTVLTATQAVDGAIYIPLDLDEIIKMIDGAYDNYGFFLKMQTETNDAYSYHSRDNTTADDFSPMVHVIYEMPN